MPKVTPFLWLESGALDAARFYVSLFPNSEVTGGEAAGPGGPPLTVSFKLDGVEFIALNGGPHFKLNEAFSMSVSCQDQAEVDRLWAALTADGGEPGRCGWLKDRFGVSWQIVPGEGARDDQPSARFSTIATPTAATTISPSTTWKAVGTRPSRTR